ncbi:hypothetical protein TNCV_4432771 [Trichonephila clavipes]|nr:hypothetical protein TNCV_4432771 [Trichonephila clavipes]
MVPNPRAMNRDRPVDQMRPKKLFGNQFSQNSLIADFYISGRSSLVVKVTDLWVAYHEMEPSTTEDPLYRRVMPVKSVEAQTSSLCRGVYVRRDSCQLRCHPRHLTMVQNAEVYRQNLSISEIVLRASHLERWVVTLVAVLLGLGPTREEGMDVRKCIVLSRHGCTLNSRRVPPPFAMMNFVGLDLAFTDQIRCPSRCLTNAQNYEVQRQQPLCCLKSDIDKHSFTLRMGAVVDHGQVIGSWQNSGSPRDVQVLGVYVMPLSGVVGLNWNTSKNNSAVTMVTLVNVSQKIRIKWRTVLPCIAGKGKNSDDPSEGDACTLAPLSVSKEKKYKMINQVTMTARRCLSEYSENDAKCELWFRLAGTRFLLLHGPQETGLTLVGGRTRSWDSSDLK